MEHYVRPSRPILSVAAVAVDDGGRIVLVRRGKAPDAGEWSIPGGAVEIGESLEAALCREVCEETGLEIAVGPLLEIYERVEREAGGAVRFHFVVVDYRCTVTGGTLRAGDDAAEVALVDPADLDRYALADSIRRVIKTALVGKLGVEATPISAATRSTPAGPAGR